MAFLVPRNVRAVFSATVACLTAWPCAAATTIDPSNGYSYGANIGWCDARGDATNGAVIGLGFCEGHLHGANVGWIHLGDGTPEDGMAYGNASASDYGVNHDGLGRLTGHAYGANIGWITFEQTYGRPQVDLLTGNLSGYMYGANIGWIGLSNAFAYARTETLGWGPDTDGDGIPDAWELGHTNTLDVLHQVDSGGDGVFDPNEFLADT